jgi:hypothetical protein
MQTNLGRNARRALISAAITDVAVGTDDTAPSAADIALGAQVDTEPIESIINGATGVFTVRTRYGVLLNDTLEETGVFDATPALMDRIVHSPIVKPAGVELLIDIRYEVS